MPSGSAWSDYSGSGLVFWSWDVGGADRVWALYRHYFNQDMSRDRGVIWMVDDRDHERLGDTKNELERVVHHVVAPIEEAEPKNGDAADSASSDRKPRRRSPLLIFLNKYFSDEAPSEGGQPQPQAQPLPAGIGNVINEAQLRALWHLDDEERVCPELKRRRVAVQECSARTGAGVGAGLAWLAETVGAPVLLPGFSTPQEGTVTNNVGAIATENGVPVGSRSDSGAGSNPEGHLGV
eukprot:CAMPEP_0172609548 /NCGR_PEP_ID=MMETSP1068-20121228/29541_1 /TAXON_ID=35684 /ORGANISM="Pseudopedinella elastica, Strain CCMP716" /LENGTH=236 /DNA_ID=CAMNT_0013413093 /DNA_START=295 /DNA_END=1002 /DNA_ORIENTATION=-